MNDKYLELENDFNDFLNSKAPAKSATVWCGKGRVESGRFRFSLDIIEDVLKAMYNKVLTVICRLPDFRTIRK
jgi:hypothetical protein